MSENEGETGGNGGGMQGKHAENKGKTQKVLPERGWHLGAKPTLRFSSIRVVELDAAAYGL